MAAREPPKVTQSRFRRECERLCKEPPRLPILAVQACPPGNRLRADIVGPDDSPFAGHRFGLLVEAGNEYPFKPPAIRFASPRRVYHPNVCSQSGGICLDILNDANLWSPALGLEKLLISVASLLSEPRTEHGLNSEALELLRRDAGAYAARASAVAARESSTSSSAASAPRRGTAEIETTVAAAPKPAADTAVRGQGVLGRDDASRQDGHAAAIEQITPPTTTVVGEGGTAAVTARRDRVEPVDRSGVCWVAFAIAIIAIGVAQRISSGE
mmetsp:Transcript_14507/g.36769  ORF Transcript_14507/g.36769 Transcript_14507/m.36769 type:complete len:271 (-) Transcript_14507:66-878(-)